jgi:hypothetical protein
VTSDREYNAQMREKGGICANEYNAQMREKGGICANKSSAITRLNFAFK